MSDFKTQVGNLQVGAYGWLHSHWRDSYYPDDLPEDWQLSYYSNDFNVVMVPAYYWHQQQGYFCESWLDAVHLDFRFYIELPSSILTNGEDTGRFLQQLKDLQSQLLGVVINVEKVQPGWIAQLQLLSASVALFGNGSIADLKIKPIALSTGVKPVELAIFDDNLTELRQTRILIEQFVEKTVSSQQTIIVKNMALKAVDLIKLRSVVEIMGF